MFEYSDKEGFIWLQNSFICDFHFHMRKLNLGVINVGVAKSGFGLYACERDTQFIQKAFG